MYVWRGATGAVDGVCELVCAASMCLSYIVGAKSLINLCNVLCNVMFCILFNVMYIYEELQFLKTVEVQLRRSL